MFSVGARGNRFKKQRSGNYKELYVAMCKSPRKKKSNRILNNCCLESGKFYPGRWNSKNGFCASLTLFVKIRRCQQQFWEGPTAGHCYVFRVVSNLLEHNKVVVFNYKTFLYGRKILLPVFYGKDDAEGYFLFLFRAFFVDFTVGQLI